MNYDEKMSVLKTTKLDFLDKLENSDEEGKGFIKPYINGLETAIALFENREPSYL